jgi:pilus assembly protein CpaC
VFSYAQQTGILSLGLSEESQPYDFGEEREPDFADKLLDCRSAGNFNSALVTHLIQVLFPNVDVTIDSTTKGFIVSGKVNDPQIAFKIIEILEKVAPGGKETVVDLMEVVPQQILICVKVMEVRRDTLFNLGVNWAAIFDDGQTNLAIGATFPRPGVNDPNYFIDFLGQPGNWSLSYIIDMLEQKGWGEVIAEPNLTTISGQTAEFFAGGEFPILIPQGGTLAGAATVEYKRFGVILEFTPFVDLNGLITLHIVPEVSRIDKNNSVVLQGFVIPSLITRRADTTVKLWPGQCYAIAGLIQNEMVERNYGLCGFDRIPILGPLFRSKKFENQKTELMIVLTPYLVNSDREITILQPNDENCPNRYCDGNPFPEQFEVRKTENASTTYQKPKRRRKKCHGMCY